MPRPAPASTSRTALLLVAVVTIGAGATALRAQPVAPVQTAPWQEPSPSPTSGRAAPAVRSIAIDQRTAERLGLRVGSRVRMSARPGEPGDSVVVAAITVPRADPSEVARQELRVRLHLDHLQSVLGLEDRVDRFAVGVRGREAANAATVDSLVAAVNHVAFGFRAHRSRDVAVGSSRTFRVVERFHRAIGVITVVASAIFLLCLLMLTVEERRRDIAALRLMGVSRGTVMRAVVLEAAAVSLLGCALGALVGWGASFTVNAHYQRVYQTTLAFALLTPEILLFATALSLLLGVIAGAAAAWRLVRTPPLALLGR